MDQSIEVVFIGGDAGDEEVRGIKIPRPFARSLSLADTVNPYYFLRSAMNGEPLPRPH